MKFKNISGKNMPGIYGYDFPTDGVVDVTEDNLIRKFKLYDTLEVQDGVQKQGKETSESTSETPDEEGVLRPIGEMSRDELRELCDERGIKYSPLAGPAALKRKLDGSN